MSHSPSPSLASSSSPAPSASASATASTEAPKRKRRKVRRTRNGCLTCRKRRKLCNLERPSCEACTRLKLTCEWAPESNQSSNDTLLAASTSDQCVPNDTRTNQFVNPPVQSRSSIAAWPQSSAPNPAMSDLMGIYGDTGPHAAPLSDPLSIQSANTLYPNETLAAGSGINQLPPSLFNANGQTNRTLDGPLTSILDGMNFDEATLQLWAAECLNIPTDQTVDPFQSLSDLLYTDSNLPPTAQSIPPPTRQHSPIPVTPHHAQLLKHYQAGLSSLVSCTGHSDTAPSAFAAFTKLAEASSSSEAGQGLHLSILAWAGRHMVNQGQVKYEAVSERLGEKATRIIMARLDEWQRGRKLLSQTEVMTLLAGDLMVVQFKICRGDVWGYGGLLSYLRQLSNSLYQVGSPGAPPDSMPFSFFENLVYHDLLSSFAYSDGPLVPYSVLHAHSTSSSDFLHTLTGVCFPLFCKMHRIASLAVQRRKKDQTRREMAWTDEELYDLVKAAEGVEEQLAQEKTQMETLIQNKPALSSHRFLHEAFRIASLMALRAFVLCEPPSTCRIQLLVRQSLSLLEEMHEKELPGFCSAHWVVFVTALCCSSKAVGEGSARVMGEGSSDCQRIQRLYDSMITELAFQNTSRSRKVVQEVWAQNQGGKVFVDWVDVVAEFDWELFLV